jgi:hypothetical protein
VQLPVGAGGSSGEGAVDLGHEPLTHLLKRGELLVLIVEVVKVGTSNSATGICSRSCSAASIWAAARGPYLLCLATAIWSMLSRRSFTSSAFSLPRARSLL